MTEPRDKLRRDLAGLDSDQKKIIGGLLAVMFRHPGRVRDREWIATQFTQVTLLSMDFESVEHPHEGLELAEEYVRANIGPLLNATYSVFLRVAEDLAPRAAEITAEDAMIAALDYLTNPGGTQ